MNWSNVWAAVKPVLIQIVTKVLIPLLIGAGGGLATYHAACQPVAPVNTGCDYGK